MSKKTAAPTTIEVTLVIERETKNYVVYTPRGVNHDAILPIHILKVNLPTPRPDGYALTLTPVKV